MQAYSLYVVTEERPFHPNIREINIQQCLRRNIPYAKWTQGEAFDAPSNNQTVLHLKNLTKLARYCGEITGTEHLI